MGEGLVKYRAICCEQPRPTNPPTFDFENLRPASRSSRPSQWLAEGKTLASIASSWGSIPTRRTHRTTVSSISAPYDFKRVEPPRERGFRPLILSIHSLGNELRPLPEFDEAICDSDAGIIFPPPALTKARSEPMLSRPSTAFTIPRKPVPSRALSMKVSRSSMESRKTFNEPSRPSQSIHCRPSMAATQSTQDFLDALDTRLPQSPPLLRSKSGPEPVYTLYRRASEQSLRLRMHLEERSQIERRLQECDTIPEDREGDLERSPMSAHATTREDRTYNHKLKQPRSTEWFRTPFPRQLQIPQQPSRAPPAPPSPFLAPATRSRISQWLRSSPLASPVEASEKTSTPVTAPFYSLRPSEGPRRMSTSSLSIYSSSTAAETLGWTTPKGSPYGKGSSLSSCLTNVQAGAVSMPFVEEKMGPVGGVFEGKIDPMEVDVREMGVGLAL